MLEGAHFCHFFFEFELALLLVDFYDESFALIDEVFQLLKGSFAGIFGNVMFLKMSNDGLSAFFEGLDEVVDLVGPLIDEVLLKRAII